MHPGHSQLNLESSEWVSRKPQAFQKLLEFLEISGDLLKFLEISKISGDFHKFLEIFWKFLEIRKKSGGRVCGRVWTGRLFNIGRPTLRFDWYFTGMRPADFF